MVIQGKTWVVFTQLIVDPDGKKPILILLWCFIYVFNPQKLHFYRKVLIYLFCALKIKDP